MRDELQREVGGGLGGKDSVNEWPARVMGPVRLAM